MVLPVGHNILWSVLQEIPRLVAQGCRVEGNDVGRGAARDEARTGGDATTVRHSQAARIVRGLHRRPRRMPGAGYGQRIRQRGSIKTQESRRA